MRRLLPAIAIVLVAISLRPGASSPGPVLQEVQAGLGMSSGVAGVLTALPGLCFGLIGLLAVALAKRVGITVGIALGLAAAAAGLVIRAQVDGPAAFIAFSAVALGGMALGNVLVPAWIKHRPTGQVALQTLYGTGLMVGGAAASLATAPAMRAFGDWRPALAMWGWAALIAIPLWAALGLRERRRPADHEAPTAPPSGGLLRSPTTLALTALFGIQSMHAYVQFGWLPQIYRDAGLSATRAGALTATLTGFGLIGGLVMPSVIQRGTGLRPWLASFGILVSAGYLGLLVEPARLAWLWVALLGTSGFAFPMAIALITARTRVPSVTAQVSGFVQPLGYLLAGLGPFLVGLLHAATGTWTVVLLVLAATGIPMTWVALRLAEPIWIDDELDGTSRS